MTPDDAQVAAVAAKLTKAQIKRLHNVACLHEAGKSWASKWGDRSAHTSRATTPALIAAGLLHVPYLTSDVALTDFGLAVRAHLLSEQSSHAD